MHRTSCRFDTLRRIALSTLLLASCASTNLDEERALHEYLATEFRPDAPGGVVLVARGEDVLVHEAYGLANLETGRAMVREDVLCIGSVTKSFAAAAVLRLVEEGVLALDDDVRLHVPDAPTAGHAVTLEQLLTHTSGMPSLVDLPDFMEWARSERTTAELVAATEGMEWLSPPGAEFHYSDSGYILLGALVETVTGEAFDEYVAREIAEPLGMTSTRSAHRPRGGEPVGYSSGEPAEAIHMSVPHASGQLASSAADLLRWARAWRDAEVASRELCDLAWAARELPDGTHSGYGFGWNAITWRVERRSVTAGGSRASRPRCCTCPTTTSRRSRSSTRKTAGPRRATSPAAACACCSPDRRGSSPFQSERSAARSSWVAT